MKNSIQKQLKRAVCGSMVAASLASLSLASHAVNLSPDQSGQVLIYPYYTTRNGFVTSFSIVNSSPAQTKVLNLNFYEGRAGALVMSFHVWLAPRDTWTASIVDRGDGAAIYTTDGSCSTPTVGNSSATAAPFSNFFYTGNVSGAIADNAGTSLDRTREGYWEVFEMGVIANGADGSSAPATSTGTALANAAAPGPSGAAVNCSIVQVNLTNPNGTDILSPQGGLTGSYTLINAATGTEFAQKAVALQNFFIPSGGSRTGLYSLPGTGLPDLSSVSPARSMIVGPTTTSGTESIAVTDWVAEGGSAIDAVTAVLMAGSLSSDFDIGTGLKSELVVTMPTKRFYVRPVSSAAAQQAPTSAAGPFTSTFASATTGAARSCDATFAQLADRGGAVKATTWDGGASGPSLCWSTSTLTFAREGDALASASVFGSATGSKATVPQGTAQGQLLLWPTTSAGFDANAGPGQTFVAGSGSVPAGTNGTTGGLRNLAPGSNRYRGLPVIGFVATQAILSGQGYGGLFNSTRGLNIAP
jgi:hypothetical protein